MRGRNYILYKLEDDSICVVGSTRDIAKYLDARVGSVSNSICLFLNGKISNIRKDYGVTILEEDDE